MIVDANCPYCSGPTGVTVRACRSCGCEIRAEFRENLFAALSEDECALLEMYLLADFSIKKLSERTGMGYLALRNRLDQLIERYRSLMNMEEETRKVLEQMEKGEITPLEAVKRIRSI